MSDDLEIYFSNSSPYLVVKSYSEENWPNYQISLCKLTEEEVCLDTGRFKNFSYSEQANIVDFQANSLFKNWFENCVEWISDHVSSNWSVSLIHHHVSHITVRWSFANRDDALLFKLSTNPVS